MLAIVATHPVQYQVPIWRELARRGRVPFEVTYFCDHGARQSFDPEFGRSFTWDVDLLEGYKSHFVHPGQSPRGFSSLHMSAAMYRRFAQARPRAIWIQGWQVAGYWETAAAAKLLGAQLWLRGESNARSGAESRRVARAVALRALFALTARFLYIGAANRAFYLAQGVDEPRLAPAPYGVENSAFAAMAARGRDRRAELRRAWSIEEDAFCFLFVGKFIAKKRPFDILDAAARLADGRKFHLLFIGEGELLTQAQARAAALSAPATFAGFLNQSEIVNAYCAADCLILPSDADETWGVVVNEAMACGLPAIISNACGCAEDLVVPGFEEFIYPVGDVGALMQSMSRVLHARPTADAIAKKIAAFDIGHTVDTVEALYHEAFGGR